MSIEDQNKLAFVAPVDLTHLGARSEAYDARRLQINTLYKLSKQQTCFRRLPVEILSIIDEKLTEIEHEARINAWYKMVKCCNRQCLDTYEDHMTKQENQAFRAMGQIDEVADDLDLEMEFLDALDTQKQEMNSRPRGRHYEKMKDHLDYLQGFVNSLSAQCSAPNSNIRPYVYLVRHDLGDGLTFHEHDDENDLEMFNEYDDPIFRLDVQACLILLVDDKDQEYGEEEEKRLTRALKKHKLDRWQDEGDFDWERVTLMSRVLSGKQFSWRSERDKMRRFRGDFAWDYLSILSEIQLRPEPDRLALTGDGKIISTEQEVEEDAIRG